MGGINNQGTNKNEFYEAMLQALNDAGLGGGGGNGGEVFPDLVVSGTSSYTIPSGFNAIVNVGCRNGGSVSINGGVILQSVSTTWTAIRQSGNLYTVSGAPSVSSGYQTYRRGGLVSTTTFSSNPSNSSSPTDNSAATVFTTGATPFSGVYSNSTAYARDTATQRIKLRAGDVITGSSLAYLVELYAI